MHATYLIFDPRKLNNDSILKHRGQTQPLTTPATERVWLDTGNRGDLLDLHVDLSPCMVGYGGIANWLNRRAETIRGDANPYDAWIAMYESDEFQDAM